MTRATLHDGAEVRVHDVSQANIIEEMRARWEA